MRNFVTRNRYGSRLMNLNYVQQIPSCIAFGPVEGIAAWFGLVKEDEKGGTMNDDRACKIIDALEEMNETLKEIREKLCKPPEAIVYNNMSLVPCAHSGIDADELRETIRGAVRKECGSATRTDIFITPETDDDKQRLDKWLEQLDKCRCPVQVHVKHDDCCEHRENDDHT